MAIGPDGKVTTTGLMDAGMKTPDAPDMSNLKPPAQAQEKTAPAAMVQKPEAKDPAVVEKLNALSDEEKVQLDMVLAPSLATILKKIAPDHFYQDENLLYLLFFLKAMIVFLTLFH